MSRILAFISACSVSASLFAVPVQALPVSSAPQQVAAPDVTLVRGSCGLGFHRGRSGHCVRNGTASVYPLPVYPPPELVAPLACPYGYHLFPYSGCFAPACANGYFLGPYGQCYPYWRPFI